MPEPIKVHEHELLRIGSRGFEERHWHSLIKLNQLHDCKYFKVQHNGISFIQYVGVIQIDDLTIEILPKVDKHDDETDWQSVLIAMLKKCGKLKADSYGNSLVKKQNLNLLELYFKQYLNELNYLINRGLVKKYRKETSNVKALKGKLEFAGHITKNLVHKERFFTTHQVYDKDHALHRILNEALSIVEQCSRGSSLLNLCKRVQLSFNGVKRVKVTKQQLDTIMLNRKTSDYQRAFELARLIILNYSPDIAGGKEKMISLLFDMNELWEEYILRVLKAEARKRDDVTVEGQKRKSFWTATNTSMNKVVKPDILIKKNNSRIIIDTKWKLPKGLRPNDQDLRQVYVYNLLWKADRSILLYPRPRGLQSANIIGEFNHGDSEEKLKHGKNGELHFYDVIDQESDKLNPNLGRSIIDSL